MTEQNHSENNSAQNIAEENQSANDSAQNIARKTWLKKIIARIA